MSQTTSHVVDADELAAIAGAMGDYAPMAYLGAVLGLGWGECAGLDGIDLKTAQTRLGHSDPRLTLAVYAQATTAADAAAAERLGTRFMEISRPGRFLSDPLARAATP